MIGLVGAMQLEMENLIGMLENAESVQIGLDSFHKGLLYGQEAVLSVCGPGKVNAALCTQSMILTFHPDCIVNLGVAGAGQEGVSIGDMVIASCAVQHDMDTSPIGDPKGYVSKVGVVQFPCDETIREKLKAAAEHVGGIKVHTGIVATGDQFISDGETRRRIHAMFDSMAVEMEGAAVAHACLVHGVPCGILRSISDQADGKAEMDYPAFSRLAAEQAQQVMAFMLGGQL